MGVESFLILNLTVFGPMLPMTIAQTFWDDKYDREFGSLDAYSFRGRIGFSVSLICMLLVPFSTHLVSLSMIALLLGFVSSRKKAGIFRKCFISKCAHERMFVTPSLLGFGAAAWNAETDGILCISRLR